METEQSDKMECICRAEYVKVRGIPTRIMKVEQCDAGHQTAQDEMDFLFLVIPGNPGIVDFYEVFMMTLFKASACRAMVWGISHAGHTSVPEEHGGITDTFSLEDQIDHKEAFLRDFVPPNKRLVLIGHSIGCHIILQVMKRCPTLPVLKALLLFPTIERMWASPNGTVMAPFLCYARWLGLLVVFLGSYLSDWVKWRMVNWFLKNRKVPKCAFHAALNLFNPSCADNALYMGATEMREVVDPDLDTIARYLPKLLFYYGARDGWCPVDYYDDMKELFPEGDIRLCKRGVAHAFCLESSELMGDLVWNWLQPELTPLKS